MGMPSWYAENGQYFTTQFFGVESRSFLPGIWLAPERIRVQCMKANRYLHDHGISQETLAKVAAKNSATEAPTPMMATSFIGRILSRPV